MAEREGFGLFWPCSSLQVIDYPLLRLPFQSTLPSRITQNYPKKLGGLVAEFLTGHRRVFPDHWAMHAAALIERNLNPLVDRDLARQAVFEVWMSAALKRLASAVRFRPWPPCFQQ